MDAVLLRYTEVSSQTERRRQIVIGFNRADAYICYDPPSDSTRVLSSTRVQKISPIPLETMKTMRGTTEVPTRTIQEDHPVVLVARGAPQETGEVGEVPAAMREADSPPTRVDHQAISVAMDWGRVAALQTGSHRVMAREGSRGAGLDPPTGLPRAPRWRLRLRRAARR